MIAAELATMRQGERTDLPSIEGKLSQAHAAELMHVGVASVERAAQIKHHGAPEVQQAVREGTLTVSAAEPLTELPREDALVLVDGHHRYAICERHGLAYTVHEQPFGSQEEAIHWMIALQLGRRNLTTEQKSYLRGKRYTLEKTRGHGVSGHHFDGQKTGKTSSK